MHERDEFTRRVRRKMIARLGLVATVISLVVGVAGWRYERAQLEYTIAKLVVEQMLFFDIPTRAGASAWKDVDYDALVVEFRRFLEVKPAHSLGRVTAARVYDAAGEQLLDFDLSTAEVRDGVTAALDRRSGWFRDGHRDWHRWVRIAGHPHILLGGAMPHEAPRAVAFAEGAFRLSPAILAELRRNVLFTVLWGMAIAFATAAGIYPIVMGLTRKLVGMAANLLQANIDTVGVLGSAIAKRDSDTSDHNFRVTIIAVRLAEALGLDVPAIRNLMKGAFVHDVGKIAIADAILLKPGKLTDDEYTIMKTHVDEGVDIVAQSNWLSEAADVVRCHHEKFDGSGYMTGLSGDAIPLNARIFAVADVFDALASRRPYKEPMSFEDSMAILQKGRGSHFDPAVLDEFARIAPAIYADLVTRPPAPARDILTQQLEKYMAGAAPELAL